jgi:hypothetical protein
MSQHKRNVEGMQKAQQHKIEASILRVKKTIQDMKARHESISFNSIAKEANVSKAWLYGQNDLCAQIKSLRDQNKCNTRHVSQTAINAKDRVIASLKDRLKKIERENLELRKQLEVVYGALHVKNNS